MNAPVLRWHDIVEHVFAIRTELHYSIQPTKKEKNPFLRETDMFATL